MDATANQASNSGANPGARQGTNPGANPGASQGTWSAALRRRATVRFKGGEAAALRFKTRGSWRSWSWRDLEDEVGSLALALSSRGRERGDLWTFVGPVTPRALALALAVARIGGRCVAATRAAAGASLLSPGAGVGAGAGGGASFFVPDRAASQALLGLDDHGMLGPGSIVVDDARGLGRHPDPRVVSYLALRGVLSEEHQTVAFGNGNGNGNGHGNAHAGDAALASSDQEVFVHAPEGLGPGWERLLQWWLEEGFVLTCAEAGGDAAADRREHGPDVLVGRGIDFDALYLEMQSNLPKASTWSRRVLGALVDGPLVGEAASLGLWPGALRRRLRTLLGLTHAAALLWADGPPSADATSFFMRLGLDVRALGAASSEAPVRHGAHHGAQPTRPLVSHTSL